MRFTTALRNIATPLSVTLLANAALAFEPTAEPNYGQHALPNDAAASIALNVRAGGNYDVSNVGGATMYCTGFISEAPDAVFVVPNNVSASTLFLSTHASSDTTLIVVDPAGETHCNDDATGRGLNAGLDLAPMAGEYKVWVGIYYPDDFPEAMLRAAFTSPVLGPKPGVRFGLDWDQAPTFEHLTLAAGFGPAPIEFEMIAGGSDTVPSSLGYDCYGYVYGAAPDYTVAYSGGGDLHISAWADADLTLVVRGPDDIWHCNDDFEGLNPGLSINGAIDGTYAVWVGTYGMDEPDAMLQFSEVRPFQENNSRTPSRKGN
ncbi:MAG: hypothetical protein JXQ97_00450 [Natronospirillum sp.]